jgi:hypothetical protein
MELQRVAILDRIDRLTRDQGINRSQELQKLRRDYNQVVYKIQNQISTPSSDIIDIFPSEVWVQIVKDALPAHGYGAALLLLTTVSSRWLEALASVPTLWACVDLRGSQEDSLATIETFKQLSGGVPLHLFIYIPTRYDNSVICEILTSIGSRVREATIRLETNSQWGNQDIWAILQLLLIKSNFNTSLVYVQMDRFNLPLGDSEGGRQLLRDHELPLSLRAIGGCYLPWQELQTQDYLERVESIDSDGPIEYFINHRIRLPNLRCLKIDGYGGIDHKFSSHHQEGFPLLPNLTTLIHQSAYRETLVQFLLSVALQLVHLELRVPHSKIPLLAAVLRAAAKLRILTMVVEERIEDGANESDLAPVYQHVDGEIPDLRDLTLHILPGHSAIRPAHAQSVRRDRGPHLRFLVSMISALYTQVERLEFYMETEYPITFEETLFLYMVCLPHLRRLHLPWLPGNFSVTENTYPAEKLEYLETPSMDLLHCLNTPNLLCLKFTWQPHGNLKALTYRDLRRIFVTHNETSPPVVDLPESTFPSLQDLTLFFTGFSLRNTYGSVKLASLPVLTSITIASGWYEPQGTMLCFALLYQPDQYPLLNEIRFQWCFPDWDMLFLMLERRNFMVNSEVSLIRRITLPFVPSGLRTPLASLLRGIYTERPPNDELFMGGARELLLDDQVSVFRLFDEPHADRSQARLFRLLTENDTWL